MPPDVHVLKVEVPSDATPDTPWQVTRLSMVSYYDPVPAQRASWDEPGPMGYRAADNWHTAEPDSDVHVLRVRRWVAVTPLSVDMTSRVSMEMLDQLLRKAES
jgi:5'-nucleotidase